MYKVIVPIKVQLVILKELDFGSHKDPLFAERAATEVNYHLEVTLKEFPGIGALASKNPSFLYYPIQERFKLVFEVNESKKQVVVHRFFHNRRRISNFF
ncbi:hypothetical protein LPY66_16445 [Dehalobacter sp. DCM]|uniref:hypothetical protein n=1 Tax=Dehalobacter sp. DCM TaxID=2907827 RepID=UPI003081A86D|nr:hypothetical protein LPY66_16445 [Dehalobacter sp. DCM]